MSLPVGGHGSQNCEKLIDRIEAEVVASLVLIGQLKFRKFHDYIPEIECHHKVKVKVQVKVKVTIFFHCAVPRAKSSDMTSFIIPLYSQSD